MGEAHLRGIQQMWATSEWQGICVEAEPSDASSNASSSTAIQWPHSYTDPSAVSKLNQAEAAGVRQALLESAMRLKTVASKKIFPKAV